MKEINEIVLYCCTLALLVLYIFASQKATADNEIFIDQSGNNFAIGVDQIGANNNATVTADGTNQQLLILQYNDSSVDNTVTVNTTGDDNGIKLCDPADPHGRSAGYYSAVVIGCHGRICGCRPDARS